MLAALLFVGSYRPHRFPGDNHIVPVLHEYYETSSLPFFCHRLLMHLGTVISASSLDAVISLEGMNLLAVALYNQFRLTRNTTNAWLHLGEDHHKVHVCRRSHPTAQDLKYSCQLQVRRTQPMIFLYLGSHTLSAYFPIRHYINDFELAIWFDQDSDQSLES